MPTVIELGVIKTGFVRALALALTLGGAAAVMVDTVHATGGRQDSTDWPCPQRKVLKLAASDLQWQGAAPETITTWRQDKEAMALIRTLASRRVPQDEAIKALKAFAAAVPASERTGRLTLVFAGLLETVNEYRVSVINGIERFNRRQKGRSVEIEAEGAKLSELQKQANADPKLLPEYEKAVELYDWNTRVFEERRQNLPLACEIPPAIDGRTFEIVREMQALMGQPG